MLRAGSAADGLSQSENRPAKGAFIRFLSFWAVCFQSAVLAFYAVFVFLDVPNRKSSSWLSYFDYYSTRIVLAVIILLLLTLINRFIVWYHHRLARGGSRFLLHFGFIVHLPWVAFSLGNCVLLLLDAWPNNTAFLLAHRTDALRAVACIQAAIGIAASIFFAIALATLADLYGELESRDNQVNFETVLEGGGWAQVPGDDDNHAEVIEQQTEMIRVLKEQRKNLTKQVAELQERLDAHDNRLTSAASTAERIRDAFAPQAKLREQRDRDEAIAQSQLKDTEIRNLRAELDEAKSELSRLKNSGDEAEPLRIKIQQLQSETRRLKTDNQQLQDNVAKMQLKLDVEKEANAEAQALIDKLNFDLSNLRNRLK